MKAMILDCPGQALRLTEIPRPSPEATQIVLEVRACGVCRTDLHVLDGELRQPRLPLILGHEIVGVVVAKGADFMAQKIKKIAADAGVPLVEALDSVGGAAGNYVYKVATRKIQSEVCDE
jgi:propanol-preferring alcohol dehydrogenase